MHSFTAIQNFLKYKLHLKNLITSIIISILLFISFPLINFFPLIIFLFTKKGFLHTYVLRIIFVVRVIVSNINIRSNVCYNIFIYCYLLHKCNNYVGNMETACSFNAARNNLVFAQYSLLRISGEAFFTRYNSSCYKIQCDKGRLGLHYCAIIRRLDNKQILTLNKLTFNDIRYVG